MQVCYNEPKVSESRQSVTLGYPVPNKVCEDKQVYLIETVIGLEYKQAYIAHRTVHIWITSYDHKPAGYP